METAPDRMASPEPLVANRFALRPGIEYAMLDDGLPDESANCSVPEIALSVGLTSRIVVVQPPPSAKCGNTAGSLEEALKSTTGNVVIKNSERSFTPPRSAITATGFDELN